MGVSIGYCIICRNIVNYKLLDMNTTEIAELLTGLVLLYVLVEFLYWMYKTVKETTIKKPIKKRVTQFPTMTTYADLEEQL